MVTYDNTTHPSWPSSSATGVMPTDPAGYVLSSISNQTRHSNDHQWGIGANLYLTNTR
jgi:hypothetical protein